MRPQRGQALGASTVGDLAQRAAQVGDEISVATSTAPASLHLQAAVARTCRLLAVVTRLAEAHRRDGPPRTRGDLWLYGRAGEIEAFVAAVFADRARGEVDDAGAARALDGYAGALEGSVRALFGGRRRRPKTGVVARREPRRLA